jgi:NADH dehydrogenase FAD-containing subunit
MQSELYNNVYIGGDCINSGYIKTAQVAYQQGAYVAKRLNGDIPKDQPFEYKPNGVLINIGNKKVIIEGHKIIPDGIYPDFVVKLYSLFFI